jgi:hypothetical protein
MWPPCGRPLRSAAPALAFSQPADSSRYVDRTVCVRNSLSGPRHPGGPPSTGAACCARRVPMGAGCEPGMPVDRSRAPMPRRGCRSGTPEPRACITRLQATRDMPFARDTGTPQPGRCVSRHASRVLCCHGHARRGGNVLAKVCVASSDNASTRSRACRPRLPARRMPSRGRSASREGVQQGRAGVEHTAGCAGQRGSVGQRPGRTLRQRGHEKKKPRQSGAFFWNRVVERRGIEPLTFAMRTRRSPS